jgi:hypothetical protein
MFNYQNGSLGCGPLKLCSTLFQTHVEANFAPQQAFHRLAVKLNAHMAVISKC